VAQVAIAWLLHRPGISTILLGASKPSQLADNLGAVNVKLSPDEMKVLDEQSPHASYYPTWFASVVRDTAVDGALASARG
jgi:aryl-alcohol dehydrogenase-like predicted oxidoreductase